MSRGSSLLTFAAFSPHGFLCKSFSPASSFQNDEVMVKEKKKIGFPNFQGAPNVTAFTRRVDTGVG
jgi:hypothetical protein